MFPSPSYSLPISLPSSFSPLTSLPIPFFFNSLPFLPSSLPLNLHFFPLRFPFPSSLSFVPSPFFPLPFLFPSPSSPFPFFHLPFLLTFPSFLFASPSLLITFLPLPSFPSTSLLLLHLIYFPNSLILGNFILSFVRQRYYNSGA